MNLLNKPKEEWTQSDFEIKKILSDQTLLNLIKKI